MAAQIASASPIGVSRPHLPLSSNSGEPVQAVEIQAMPILMASSSALDSPSYREERTNISASRISL